MDEIDIKKEESHATALAIIDNDYDSEISLYSSSESIINDNDNDKDNFIEIGKIKIKINNNDIHNELIDFDVPNPVIEYYNPQNKDEKDDESDENNDNKESKCIRITFENENKTKFIRLIAEEQDRNSQIKFALTPLKRVNCNTQRMNTQVGSVGGSFYSHSALTTCKFEIKLERIHFTHSVAFFIVTRHLHDS